MISKENTRIIAHACLGSAIGFLVSVIFILLYYGIQYTQEVSDHVRFSAAFWDTSLIASLILMIMFHKDLIRILQSSVKREDNNDE